MIRRVVVDALQVGNEPTGVGRQAQAIGAALHDLPGSLALELRCAAATAHLLVPAFPSRTLVRTPIPASRPRARRALQQLVRAPLRDDDRTLLVALGDQGPVAGRARVLLVVNDVRRLTRPSTAPRLEALWYRALVPLAARHASTIVTISEFSRNEIARTLARGAIVVAHHPPPRAAVPAATPDGGPLVVVGALRPYKGTETVVDALAILGPAERPEVVFCGPDEGGGDALRRRIAERNVGDKVRLTGWLPDDDVDALLALSAATVNPSLYEGYGLGVAESLARGLPTIGSSIPPHVEVDGSAALLVPPDSPPALAEAIRSLTSRDRRLELARVALERSYELARRGPTWSDVLVAALHQ